MKRLQLKAAVLAFVVALGLAGCGEEQVMDGSDMMNETVEESSSQESASAESSEAAGGAAESSTQEISSEAAESSESVESSEEGLTPEEQEAKEKFEYWDEFCNFNEPDLEPMLGDYYVLNPEPEDAFPYVLSPDGDVYGFYDDLTDGCSVWCAIDYETYVNAISATSTLEPQGKNSYEAGNLGDGSRSTAWVEGVEGNGIGESVTIVRKYTHGGDAEGFEDYGYDSFYFPNLCIVNGLAKSEKAWSENGRVKSLKMYFNEEYIATLELEDSMQPQFISLSGLHLSARDGEESTFRFEIAEVYPGDKYEDTAITGIEIEVFTENH